MFLPHYRRPWERKEQKIQVGNDIGRLLSSNCHRFVSSLVIEWWLVRTQGPRQPPLLSPRQNQLTSDIRSSKVLNKTETVSFHANIISSWRSFFYRPTQQVHQCGSGMAATLFRGTTWDRDVGLSFDGRDRISLIQGSSRWCYQLEGMTDWWYLHWSGCNYFKYVFPSPLNFVPYHIDVEVCIQNSSIWTGFWKMPWLSTLGRLHCRSFGRRFVDVQRYFCLGRDLQIESVQCPRQTGKVCEISKSSVGHGVLFKGQVDNLSNEPWVLNILIFFKLVFFSFFLNKCWFKNQPEICCFAGLVGDTSKGCKPPPSKAGFLLESFQNYFFSALEFFSHQGSLWFSLLFINWHVYHCWIVS